MTMDAYDAGLLNDFGGGDVDWWQDYIRAELSRSHDFYATHIERLEQQNAKLREALERLSILGPARANARTAADLYLTVRAIAQSALDRAEGIEP